MNDIEQTEWRSGNVVVTDDALLWLVDTPNAHGSVRKDLAPNPHALADFIASQQPAPRYCAKQWGNASGEWEEWAVRDRVEKRVVVYGYPDDVERIAAALNAYEADQ